MSFLVQCSGTFHLCGVGSKGQELVVTSHCHSTEQWLKDVSRIVFDYFFNMGQIQPLFVNFRPFLLILTHVVQNSKIIVKIIAWDANPDCIKTILKPLVAFLVQHISFSIRRLVFEFHHRAQGR